MANVTSHVYSAGADVPDQLKAVAISLTGSSKERIDIGQLMI